jgi:O-acetylhomoserine/O-acetylserine sulfhydrylase-like pyridoxal-dependent enzyme
VDACSLKGLASQYPARPLETNSNLALTTVYFPCYKAISSHDKMNARRGGIMDKEQKSSDMPVGIFPTIRSKHSSVEEYYQAAEEVLKQKNEILSQIKKYKFDTIAVNGLYTVEEAIHHNQGALIEPLYLGVAQAYQDSDEWEGAFRYKVPSWCYGRYANPTVWYLEQVLALLEAYHTGHDASCLVTASGMSAIKLATDALLAKQKQGPEDINFISSIQLYGGTFQQFTVRQKQDRGIDVRFVEDQTNIDEWKEKIDENTRFLYTEAPSNPQLAFCDIEAIVKLAHEWEIPFIIDATCGTPALMRPIAYGADIVIHSLTKSIGSSGLGMGGALISRKPIVTKLTNDNPFFKESFAEYIKWLPFRDTGPAAAPMNSYMFLNDLRTLRPRMDMLSQSCQKVAEFLEKHPRVYQVDFLGLPSSPLHDLAKKYMKLVDSDDGQGNELNRYGHLMGFRVEGPPANARKVFDNLKLIFRAGDLGRIKSMATLPALSTHLQPGEEFREKADIPAQMIRLCVGAEDPGDLMADLEQALNSL